ncbi:MAG: thiamine-phosphate kinase [Acidobacteriota bacterium]|jgi:thiamine-monophosphate kinase|nr:thiamine-phosphate kinase [Acidobacteriota bacterium]
MRQGIRQDTLPGRRRKPSRHAEGSPIRAGEDALVEFLKDRFPPKKPALEKGIGDDAAIWRPHGGEGLWAVTTDMLVEGIDFRREWTAPEDLGYKSLAVNLSDLAAMGAAPRFFTVALALPPDLTGRWVRRFYDGIAECGDGHGAALVGGDLSGGGTVVVSITAFGESGDGKVVCRSGARAGDLLYVTGTLGRSAAGLELLRQGATHPRAAAQREALRAHRKPEPRCAAGAWLARSGCVRAMMDISDGLSTDLPRLCAASGDGAGAGMDAEVFPERLPAFAPSSLWGCDPLALACDGGEDYELLFAVPRARRKRLLATYPPDLPAVTHIGNMVEGRGKVWLVASDGRRRPLPPRGFDHFAR